MKNIFSLEGQKILVTGASSGIGQATAVLISRLGAKVVACGRNYERLSKTLSMLQGCDHKILQFDVADFDSYDAAFEGAVSDGEKLTGFVHSAGIQRALPIRILNKKNIEEIMSVNFTSFLLLTSMFSKKKYSERGNVVGVSAINAHNPQTAMTVYAASKGAMEAAVKTMALEFAKSGRRINCVVPGAIDTPMTNSVSEETRKKINSSFLLGVAKPDVVANMIAFLLSDASSYTTGRAFYVDGGNLASSI